MFAKDIISGLLRVPEAEDSLDAESPPSKLRLRLNRERRSSSAVEGGVEVLFELVRRTVGLEKSRLLVGIGGLAGEGGTFDVEQVSELVLLPSLSLLYELACRRVGSGGRGIRG